VRRQESPARSSDEDGIYVAECPSIPGCISQGRSESEAQQNIADAIRECLAVREELNLPLRIDMHEVEVTV
jgi:predicted RNase H-like HicB family nuclease